jgi:hypothetical protein
MSDFSNDELDNQMQVDNIEQLDSDVGENDTFDTNDLFGPDNEYYQKSMAFLPIKCPGDDLNNANNSNDSKNYNKKHPKAETGYFQFKFYMEVNIYNIYILI